MWSIIPGNKNSICTNRVMYVLTWPRQLIVILLTEYKNKTLDQICRWLKKEKVLMLQCQRCVQNWHDQSKNVNLKIKIKIKTDNYYIIVCVDVRYRMCKMCTTLF